MKKINLDELKQLQITMLKNIHDFCEKENIKYFLCYGTLLGAIRHRGYIPWDDDIDIAMPRPDYERFFKIFQSDTYEALNCDNSKDYLYSFGKVYDKRTIMQEYISFKQKTGIYIDVFPFDGVPENINETKKIVRKIQYYLHVQNLKKNKIRGIARSPLKQILYIMLQFLAFFYSYRYIVTKINKICQTYNYAESKYVSNLNLQQADQKFLRNDFDTRLLTEFEGYQFYIPKGYDEWLTKVYGDYMQEPPENERESTHKFVAWWNE